MGNTNIPKDCWLIACQSCTIRKHHMEERNEFIIMKSNNKSPKVGQQIPSINFAVFPPVVCFRILSIKLSKLLSRSFWYSIYHSDLSFLLRLQISAIDCSSSDILLGLMYTNMFTPLFLCVSFFYFCIRMFQ